MQITSNTSARLSIVATFLLASAALAQAPAPRVSGAVKSNTAGTLVITTPKGVDVTVAVSDTAKLLQVAPGSTTLAAATPATLESIATGDKVVVTGTAGDDAATLHAVRIIVMRSADIAQTHAAEEEAWSHGSGGLVKAVDASSGTVTVTSGARTLAVKTTSSTHYRRYSGDSVRFSDATASKLGDIQPGDQLRVRGTKSDDGDSITAEEIVTGSFRNYSGVLTAINGTDGTVTFKDLATHKVIVVKVSTNSDLRRLPPQAAARFAARASGTSVGPAGTAPGTSAAGASGPGGRASAGMDLSQMLSRLPTETLGGLKVGDAVMIVATAPAADESRPSAVTLLAGVEPILQASPQGEFTLSPWSMGGGAGGDAGGGR